MRLVSTLAHVVPGEVPEHEPGRVFTRLGAFGRVPPPCRSPARRTRSSTFVGFGARATAKPNLVAGLVDRVRRSGAGFPIDRSDLPAQSLNVGARREIEQVQDPRGNAIDLITNPALHAGHKGRGAGELTGVYDGPHPGSHRGLDGVVGPPPGWLVTPSC